MNFLKKSVSKGWSAISGTPSDTGAHPVAAEASTSNSIEPSAAGPQPATLEGSSEQGGPHAEHVTFNPSLNDGEGIVPAPIVRQNTPYPFNQANEGTRGQPSVKIDDRDVVHLHPHFGIEEKVETEDNLPLERKGAKIRRVPTPFPREFLGDLTTEELADQAAEYAEEDYDVVTTLPPMQPPPANVHHAIHRVPTPYPHQEIPQASAAHHEPSAATAQAQGMHANAYYNQQVNEYLHQRNGQQAKHTKPGKLGSLQTTDAELCSGGAWRGPKPKGHVPQEIHFREVDINEIPEDFKGFVNAMITLFDTDSEVDPDDPSLGKKRVIESNSKRLGGLFTLLANGEVSEEVQSKLIGLGEALHKNDHAAVDVWIRDLTANNWDECSFWLTTVRRLTKLSKT